MGCIWDKTWPCFRDRLTHNDIIGTTYLCMSKISAPGGELEGKGRRQDVAHGACAWSRAACCWLGLVLAGRKERPGRALPGHRGWGRSQGGAGRVLVVAPSCGPAGFGPCCFVALQIFGS